MKRSKWIIGVRNKLAMLAAECDSAAAIEGAQLTSAQRSRLQNEIRTIVNRIDKEIA